jgi:hypothetical protein
LSDFNQILNTDASKGYQTKNLEPGVYFDIQDGGGGHLGFGKITITRANIGRFQ